MPSRDLTYNLIGKDVSASSVFGNTADSAEKMSTRIGSAISDLGDKIGGELGGILNTVGSGLEKFGETGASMGAKMSAAGVGIAGLGIALGELGSSDKAAEQQLSAAISATGDSISNYSKQIDEAVNKGEDFGHSAADVDNALAALTEATGDTATSLQYMGLVENLAAAKNESLTAAAQQVAKVLGGNSKLLKQYGIDMGSGTLTTAELTAALGILSSKLAGQASAASDTFSGHIDSVKEHVLDFASRIGSDVAPSLTLIGTAATVAGAGVDILTARAARATASELEQGAASNVTSGALTKQAITAATLSESLEGLRLAEVQAAVANDNLSVALEGATLAEGEFAAAADAADASMLASMGPVALFLAAVVGLEVAFKPIANDIGNWIDGNQAALGTLKNLIPAMSNLGSAISQDGDAYGAMTQKALVADIANSGLMKTLNGSKITLSQIVSGVGESDAAWGKQLATWKASGQINDAQAVALGAVKSELDAQTISTQAADAAVSQLGIATDTTGASLTQTLAPALDTVAGLEATVYSQSVAAANALLTQSNNSITATTDQDSFTNSLSSFNTTLSGYTAPAVKQVTDLVTAYDAAINELSGNTLSASEDQDKFQLSLNGLAGSLTKVGTGSVLASTSVVGNTTAAVQNRDAILDQIQAINQIATAQMTAGESTAAVNATLTTNEAKLKAAAIAAGLNKTQVAALIAEYAINPTTIGPKMAADAAATAAASLSGSVSDNTSKINQNQDAVLSAIQAINGIATAQLNAGEPISTVTANLGKNEAQLYKVATQAGMTKAQVKTLVDEYGLIPATINTTVSADTAEAEEKLAVVDALSDAANNRASPQELLIAAYAESSLKGDASGGMLSYAASGTTLGGAGYTEVGEYGPEIVGPDGRVYPAGQTSQMKRPGAGFSSAGGGIVNNYYVTMSSTAAPTAQDGQRVLAALEMALGQGAQLHLGRGSIVSRSGRIG